MAALKAISDLAVELAKALGRRAIAAVEAGEEAAEAAEKSFSRATRTVRLSQSLLDEDVAGEPDEQPYGIAGAAQRLRDVLRPWMVPEPGEAGEGESREREARERLVETEGDGSLRGAWRNLADHAAQAAPENPSPSMGEGQGWGCSRRGSGEDRGWAPEPSAPSSSSTGDAPPSQPFPHRGGRALSEASEIDPEGKARGP